MILGLTNGCFDLLHEGHLHLLRECRKYCDRLVVAVNSDASIRHMKGQGRPVDELAVRLYKLKRTGLADIVTVFDNDDELQAMMLILRPQVLFKGAEYMPGEIVGWNMVKKTIRIPMLPGVSTTQIIRERRATDAP